MLDKVDISRIVKDHFGTLRDYRTGRVQKVDILVLFGASPLLAAGLLTYFHGALDSTTITIATASLSVFAALLFNLLLLVYDAVRGREAGNDLQERFLRELFSNISFAILASILAIVFLLGLSLIENDCTAKSVVSFVIYFLVVAFLITLLMILKRVHVLIAHEFNDQ